MARYKDYLMEMGLLAEEPFEPDTTMEHEEFMCRVMDQLLEERREDRDERLCC